MPTPTRQQTTAAGHPPPTAREPSPGTVLANALAALLWASLGLSALVFGVQVAGMGRTGSPVDDLHARFLGLADTISTAGAAVCLVASAVGLYLGSLRGKGD